LNKDKFNVKPYLLTNGRITKTPISSIASNIPAITIWPSNSKVIRLDAGYPGGPDDNKSDPRSNQLIYDALKSIGKIK